MSADTVEQGIYDMLVADTNTGAIVSTRVYPAIRGQQTALPAITYTLISTNKEYNLAGSVAYTEYQYEIAAVAADNDDCLDLVNAAEAALAGWGAVELSLVEREPDTTDAELNVFRRVLVATIWEV